MKPKVILSAGGTGGHLFPAQAVAGTLPCEVLFVAGGLSTCRYFDRAHFSYHEIPSATFSFANPKKVLSGSVQIAKGFQKSLKILDAFQPDVVVGFGSFFTLPLLLAAKWRQIPIILHEQNAIPGKVNRLISRFAHTTAITFPHSSHYLKGKVAEVAFPIRKQSGDEVDFGLNPEKPILLVFGGSQGAVHLNHLVLECAKDLKEFQILHFTGDEERAFEAQECYQALGISHCVKAFEPRMDKAMEIADFAITRAGASTIAELVESETPAILIPYPFATEDHQTKNAEHFVEKIGGGEVYLEQDLNKEKLLEAIRDFSLEKKRRNIQEYKKEHEKKKLDELIMDVINGK